MKHKERSLLLSLFIALAIILVASVIVYLSSFNKNSVKDTRDQNVEYPNARHVEYVNNLFNFRLSMPGVSSQYLLNPREITYTSKNPYNAIYGIILCVDPDAGEQCNDGIIIHVYEKSKCLKNELDETSSEWCALHLIETGVSRWLPIVPGGVVTALWISDSNYLISIQPSGDEARSILEQSQATFVQSPTSIITESSKAEAPAVPIQVTTIQKKDTISPKAYILSPENNAHVRAPVKIAANVTDDVGIERVEFYAGSSDYQLIAIVKQAPFEATWVPSAGFNGYGNTTNIPVYIKAYDSSGNYGGSSIVVFLDQ